MSSAGGVFLSNGWSEQALTVLKERYLAPGETPEGMCRRVADRVGLGESQAVRDRFYRMMVEKRFLPNSPTLMNAGRNDHLQYSACYVLPVEDSVEGIYEAVKRAAIVHQSGGGTGFSFSRLRPRGSPVRTSGGVASGPVSFMKVFDAATEAIKQGGRRRGANMGILHCDHQDIGEFIQCKLSGGITNFNISVAATDEFMQKANPLLDEIARCAWQSGDPGLFFIDRCNNSAANPVETCGPIEATNPCGEAPLYPNEACNLGSVNLSKFVDGWDINWELLSDTVFDAVTFLDDVINVNPYPLPAIAEAVRGNRRIGLGVMGWADMLAMLKIPYASQVAIETAHRVMEAIQEAAVEATEELAFKYGSFPNWSKSIYAGIIPRRNATVTTIAPTGTISIIADCSSGIEPIFAREYEHRANGRVLKFKNPLHEHSLTAHEIPWSWHIQHQAAFQAHTENGVSKTINMPSSVGWEEVKKAYQYAYDLGCMGITIFRDGCKGEQVLNAAKCESCEV